ncbi:hypothetical protein K1W69_18785 [Hoeflea sp. WL0058]|uniref:Uncharacterized protein n=1 Tax=Flavimaribacter sediminis TaxID=2865987 RepID=A0AAE3D1U1_9HYPH|nr:hypothetical protein [Flavimaribacter sediminis]MBW8639249.1 hypothetical protein [Flavimaribacter sediminis]
MTRNDRASAIAAAIILAGAFGLFYFMPQIMLFLGEISPWLAIVIAVLCVLAFFAVFWLRGLYKQRHDGDPDEG